MTEQQRAYYAIIPANVRYDKALPANAKLLYGEITALCNERGYCWASNQYFAELYGVSKKSVSSWINSLVAKGYITSQVHYKKGTKEIENRYLSLNTPIEENVNTYGKKRVDPIEENLNTPIEENVKENNTVSFNNTSNKQKERKKLSYNDIVSAYTENEKLATAIFDFIAMRKLIKAPLTDSALDKALKKLNTLEDTDAGKIAVLEQSTMNSWRGLFPLKGKQSPKPVRSEIKPEWIETPEDEIERMRKMHAHYVKGADP